MGTCPVRRDLTTPTQQDYPVPNRLRRMKQMPRRHRTESASSPRRILAKQHAAAALELRIQGYQFREIAEQIGYKSVQSAHAAVTSALAALPTPAAAEYRKANLERLDRLRKGNWKPATSGEHKAIASELAIQDREARYLGLDAPAKQLIAQDVRILIEIVPSPALQAPKAIEGKTHVADA